MKTKTFKQFSHLPSFCVVFWSALRLRKWHPLLAIVSIDFYKQQMRHWLKKNANKCWGDVYSSADCTKQEATCDAFRKIIGEQCGKWWCSLGFCFYFNIGIHRRLKNNEQLFQTSSELKTIPYYCEICLWFQWELWLVKKKQRLIYTF